MFKNLKYKIRRFILKYLRVRAIDYALSPFEFGDAILIVVRENKCGTKGLGARIGKLGIGYYGGNDPDYFEDNAIEEQLKFLLLRVKPEKILVIDEFNQHSKTIKEFTKWLSKQFKGKVTVSDNHSVIYGDYQMFN